VKGCAVWWYIRTKASQRPRIERLGATRSCACKYMSAQTYRKKLTEEIRSRNWIVREERTCVGTSAKVLVKRSMRRVGTRQTKKGAASRSHRRGSNEHVRRVNHFFRGEEGKETEGEPGDRLSNGSPREIMRAQLTPGAVILDQDGCGFVFVSVQTFEIPVRRILG